MSDQLLEKPEANSEMATEPSATRATIPAFTQQEPTLSLEPALRDALTEPPARPEPPSPRALLRRHYEDLAVALAGCYAFEERLEIYERSTYRELSHAAALRPDLMPVLNGEFEWIALTRADLD